MSPNNRYYRVKATQPLRELPRTEWIAVLESKLEFEKRVWEVREIIARMCLNAKKRGRPSRMECEEEHAA